MIHDHEKTFYKYGSAHQECLAHVLRYLKGSIENEPERTWNKDMHSLLQEMVHYVNGVESGEERDSVKIHEYETRYAQVLKTASSDLAWVRLSVCSMEESAGKSGSGRKAEKQFKIQGEK